MADQEQPARRKRRLLPSFPNRQSGRHSFTVENNHQDRIEPNLERLSKISPEILAQLKAVEHDSTLIPGQTLEEITDTELIKSGKKGTVTMKSGKRMEISLVEGSFRRIAGIRELADTSGSFAIRTIEIKREVGKSLGFYIRQGDGWFQKDGIFVSRVNLGSIVQTNGLLNVGDEIIRVNNVEITKMALEDVVVIMQYVEKLVLTVKVLTSVSLTRTWSLRHHPSRTSFIHRQREMQTQQQTRQSPSSAAPRPEGSQNGTSFLNSTPPSQVQSQGMCGAPSDIPEILLDEEGTDLERPDHPYEVVGSHRAANTSPNDTSLNLPGMDTSKIWISTESLSTGGSSDHEETTPEQPTAKPEEPEFIEFHTEDLEPPTAGQEYWGKLVITLHSLKLNPCAGGVVSCSISIDSTVRANAQVKSEASEVHFGEVYHISLLKSSRLSLSLSEEILTSSKSLHLSHIFPSVNNTSIENILLKIEPIGALKVSLEYQPMSVAIPRMSPENTGYMLTTATFKELADSNPNQSNLPLVVERCIKIIEQHGLETPGIYQVCASEAAKSEALNCCIKTPEGLHEVVSRVSVHAFAGVLKDFFLNLPEPFFTNDICSSLTEAASVESASNPSSVIAGFIQCLPDNVLTTLKFLLTHLKRICDHGGMSEDELARIFGPLLLIPALGSSSSESYANDLESQANVIKILLSQHTPSDF